MTQQTFDSFLTVYKAMVSPYQRMPRANYENLSNYHTWYESTYFETRGVLLEVLRRIQDITIRDLYKPNHILDAYLPESYLDTQAVVFKERAFGLHDEMKNILFYSLLSGCRKDVEQLIYLFDDKDFQQQFGIYLKDKGDYFELNNFFAEQFSKKFEEVLEQPRRTIQILQVAFLLDANVEYWIFHKKRTLLALEHLENFNAQMLHFE